MIAPSVTAIEAMLDDVLGDRPRFDPEVAGRVTGPHLVVVLDGATVEGSDHLLAGAGLEGVTVLDLTLRPPHVIDSTSIILNVDADGHLSAETMEGDEDLGTADGLDIATLEGLARQLAPLRLTAGAQGDQPLSADLGLAELLDLGDPYDFDPENTWLPRPSRDRLRVRFGLRADGHPIELDLKESAQEGMGPHGLLIGATGIRQVRAAADLGAGARGHTPTALARTSHSWTSRAERPSHDSTSFRTPVRRSPTWPRSCIWSTG